MQLSGGKAVQVEEAASAKALRQEQGRNFQGMAKAAVAGAEGAMG